MKNSTKKLIPWLVALLALLATALALRGQGRLWRCACGYVLLWFGDAWGPGNSQHVFDPYSFTHLLHGFIFCGLLWWLLPRVPLVWRWCLAVVVEACWEILENSEFVIRRYRETTAALGYEGDTVVNSLGDVVMCGLGFALAARLGWRRSLVLFAATEILLLWWIRDGLLLNILMLIYPFDAIRAWQQNH